MKKEEVINFYINSGYVKDRWGNYIKEFESGTIKKLKFKDRVLSISYKFSERDINEKNLLVFPNKWIKTNSVYYSKIWINESGKITNKKIK